MADYKKIKVLLAITHVGHSHSEKLNNETEESIRKQLQAQGYDPIFIIRKKKEEIQKYLAEDVYCSYAVIMELADGTAWNENELAMLVDERNINLVVVLTNARKTQPTYLMTLYAAGITSAIFEGDRGVNSNEVADLLVHPRSKRKAREYYGINTNNISIRSLTNEMYSSMCVRLADPEWGSCPMARLLKIAPEVNPYQMADFLEKIPQEIRQQLEQFEEYGQLIEQLRESRIYVRYRRPRTKDFKKLDDIKPFNESAAEELSKAGFDDSEYRKTSKPEKKKLSFFGRKKDADTGKEPPKSEEVSEKEEERSLYDEEEEVSVIGTNAMDFTDDDGVSEAVIVTADDSYNDFDDIDVVDVDDFTIETPMATAVPVQPKADTVLQDDDEDDPFF